MPPPLSGPPGWHAIDDAGHDLATGRPPQGPGASTPAAAVAAAPAMSWPLRVVDGAGRSLGLAAVLGPGGDRVTALISGLVAPRPRPPHARLLHLALDTPAGRCALPVHVVGRAEAAGAARHVDRDWVAAVAERRSAPRAALLQAGRGDELEAALHVTMLLAVEYLPATDGGADVRAASGAQLWILGGMVTAALAGGAGYHFGPWSELLGCGLWPIGPSRGRLVVGVGPDKGGASPPRTGPLGP